MPACRGGPGSCSRGVTILPDFNDITRKQTELFFNELLPRYIKKYYRGRGYYFIRRMLHDLDGNKFLEILDENITVTPDLLAKSLNIKKICPIRVCREAQFGPDESVVLGHFSHVERYSASGFGPNTPFLENPASEYRTTYESKSVVLFEGSFDILEIREEKRLSFQVLKTIFHEYVHFFESYFLRSEQTLTSREEKPQGLSVRRYSLEEARGMDDRFIYELYLARFAFISAIAAMLWVLFFG